MVKLQRRKLLIVIACVFFGTTVVVGKGINNYQNQQRQLKDCKQVEQLYRHDIQMDKNLLALKNTKSKQMYLKKYAKELRSIKIKKQRLKRKQNSLSRGGFIDDFRILKEVTCYISYYTNCETSQEGGKKDKKGKLLENHDEPICALPNEVPYGYYLLLDKKINGSNTYKNVDTGGAIYFLNDENTKMKVDIFIPDKTEKWLYRHTKKRVIKGWICTRR